MNDLTEFAPIVLFVYNRPWHTEQTLKSLKLNGLSSESKLYIYSDGPKENDSIDNFRKISEVRTIIKSQKWCGEVIIIESNVNKGLAKSIRDGVTEIINQHDKVIVLEDDLELSPTFLNFMNESLNYYNNYDSVFSISGYNLPATKMSIPVDYTYDVYVSLRNGSWGWATWKNRWDKVDWSAEMYTLIDNNSYIKEAFNRGGDDIFPMLKQSKEKIINIWSIYFTLAHFVNHSVTIVPVESFVNNIGIDNSGENCKFDPSLNHLVLNNKKKYRFLPIIYEDKRIINLFNSVNSKRKRPIWKKVINKMMRVLGRENIFVLKSKVYH